MTGTRRLIVAGALLLSAGVAGSLALAAGDDHGKHATPAAKATASVPAEKTTKAAKPVAKSAGKSAAHTPKSESSKAAASKSAPKAEPGPTDSHASDDSKGEAPKAEAPATVAEKVPSTPDEALAALIAGNERWVSGKVNSPNTSVERRADVTTNGQHPYATIYTCADSRLPVERLFDCGVGDTFVLRIAGNMIGEHATGTIEYGVEHLHTPLLVIMGHAKCGAVSAACAGGHVGGSIDSLIDAVKPAVERARAQNPDATDAKLIELSIKENVWQSIFDLLRTSEMVRDLVSEGKIKVVGAVCDISTGKVQFLGEHPWQSQLMQAFAGSESAPALAKQAPKAEAKESHAEADEGHDGH